MNLIRLSGPISLTIPADPASLFIVRAVVDRLSLQMDFSSEVRERMVLGVDEACANVIRHAYGNAPGGEIIISFTVDAEFLKIEIRDFGRGADPAGFIPRSLEELRPGGLGIHFIRSSADVVQYEVPPGGGTLLKMIQYRKAREVAAHD